MAVDTTWTDPSTGSALDKADGAKLYEAFFDLMCSNFKHLAGPGGLGVARLINEFKGFPGIGVHNSNIGASGASPCNLWWRDDAAGVAITLVNCTTEGIPTTYGDWALKCIAAGATNGPAQPWTYSEESRVKGGRVMSALCAAYVPAGRTVTARLTDSAAATDVTAVSVTTGAWELLAVENKTLAGTWAKFKVLPDAACTFYVIPLGANIGTRAYPLPPRPTRWVDNPVERIINGVDLGGAAFTDLDLTANTSPLAFAALLSCGYQNATTPGKIIEMRRNGDAADNLGHLLVIAPATGANYYTASKIVYLDDGQVLEYRSNAAAGDTEAVLVNLAGYQEWA